jgi:hypothetical protein
MSLLTIPGNDSVAISLMVTLSPQLFIASISDMNGCPTVTAVHDCSGGNPIISGGVVHGDGLTT